MCLSLQYITLGFISWRHLKGQWMKGTSSSCRERRSPHGAIIRWITADHKPHSRHVSINKINVKNFHGSLTTVVRAQNDTSITANITDTIFDITLWYSFYKRRRFENRWDQTLCSLLIKDVLSVIEDANLSQRQNLKQKVIQDSNSDFWINKDPDVRRIRPKIVDVLPRHRGRHQSFRKVWYKSAVDCMKIEKMEKC